MWHTLTRYAMDVLAVALALPGVEMDRRRGPGAWLPRVRSRAHYARRREPEELAHLRRVISWADRAMPGGPNCYRRVLLQMRIDAGAAEQRIHLGLMEGGGRASGHAWLEGEDPGRRYDAEIVL